MILIDSRADILTTVLGEAEKTYIVNNGILMLIIVNPETSNTTFDFRLTDVNNNIVFSEENCQGEFNQEVNIPCYGNMKLEILNSSVDENYNCTMAFRKS